MEEDRVSSSSSRVAEEEVTAPTREGMTTTLENTRVELTRAGRETRATSR